jgi:hypothetical protein
MLNGQITDLEGSFAEDEGEDLAELVFEHV